MIAQLNQPSLKGLKQKQNTTAIEEPGFIGGLLYWSCIIFFFSAGAQARYAAKRIS